MSRLGQRFADLRAGGRKGLVTYVTAGDPDPLTTPDLLHRLATAGADVLELGVPFSDPTADGPAIQAAHERALAHGVTLARTLDMVAAFRRDDDATPIVLMGYMNPIEAMGQTTFADRAAAAGVDGIIAVDLPPEEAATLHALLRERGIDLIFLVAPTTTSARVERIASLASGFIYYVSLKGTTGAGNLDTAAVADGIGKIRPRTDLPVAVGFGIRDGQSAARLAAVADAVVVGSALIQCISATDNERARLEAAADFVAELRTALDGAPVAPA
jgi:tryptophan synthase alpha chain